MKKYLLTLVVLVTSLFSMQGQSIDQNYVKETVYKRGFQENVVDMAENDEKIETVQYFDGLGRPKQSVAIRQGGNKLVNNIIDWKNNWTLGSGSAPFFIQNGVTTENERLIGTDPHENESILWRCGNDATNNADGGWNTEYFEIDNTVGYRYTVWVKRTGSQDGKTYHGTQNVNNLSGTANTNPYFWSGDMPNLDQWYLLVGIIHPHSYSGGNSVESGVYDVNGNKVLSCTDFKWASTTVTSKFRSYLYYATDINVRQYFFNPMVQRLDGNEASIEEMIQNQTGKDIITPIDYDAYGRQDKDYLPYAETTNNGLYRNDALDPLAGVGQFYDTPKYDNTQNPYSEKLFENSPLNRILEQTAPGEAWEKGDVYDTNNHSDGNTIKFTSSTNTTATEVRLYQVNLDNNYTPTLELSTQNNGYYGINQLYKTITKDENWESTQTNLKDHSTEEFKDKRGRVVLKRTYDNNVKHDTYYVYDDYGNLTYVLPPKMDATTTIISTINNQLDDLGYQYKYDNRNRLVEKKIPGEGLEYILYNKIDQPIITQDEVQRNKTTKEWLFTKYDAFGRVAYTGLRQYNVDKDVYQGNITATPTPVAETSRTTATTIAGTTIYYNSVSVPTTVNKIYTINYYDNYNFLNSETITVPTQTSYGEAITSNTKGLTTGSKIRVLGTDYWIITVTAYDDHKRPVWVYTKNDYLGTVDIIESRLKEDADDIRGLVLESNTRHQKTGHTDIVTIDKFTYDQTGRLLSQRQEVTSRAEEVIVQNHYDDLGQLVSKGVGGKTTKTRFQNIDYKYNIRGWLTQINDVNNISNEIFAFKINYNDIADTNKKLYNGNISQILWRTANTDNSLKDYEYTYDALNRITSAIDNTNNYSLGSTTNPVTYDKNGNIQSLVRKGHIVDQPVLGVDTNNDGQDDHFGTMDDLTYFYDSGNKLMKVEDMAIIDHFGFKDDAVGITADTSNDYTYDLNGNLFTDTNKGITSILYNHLNLPTEIKFDNSNTKKINYTYDASGIKLKKVVNDGGNIIITDYANGYIYENNTLQFFNHPEGYIEPDGSFLRYVYNYTDHLGNVRLTYSDLDGDGAINATTEIIEENNYYPFGLKHKGYNAGVSSIGNSTAQKFKYNGVELEESFGLNLYEMDMRQYDPAIARWTSIDPVTHHSMSPYVTFDNNPVFWSDPSGADSYTTISNFYEQGIGADGLTNEQWLNLSRSGGGVKYKDALEKCKANIASISRIKNLESSATIDIDDLIFDGIDESDSEKAKEIVNAYLTHLTLSAYRFAQFELSREGKVEYTKKVDLLVPIGYSKSDDIITGDYGVIEFGKNYSLKSVKSGYSGKYIYEYSKGSIVTDNSLFRNGNYNKVTKKAASDGLFLNYYMVEFYNEIGDNFSMGRILFKTHTLYTKFENHFMKLVYHFKIQIEEGK